MSVSTRLFVSRLSASRNTTIIAPPWDGYIRSGMEKHLVRLLEDRPFNLEEVWKYVPGAHGWSDSEETRFKYCDWLIETEVWPAYYIKLVTSGKDKAIKEQAYREQTSKYSVENRKTGNKGKIDYGPKAETGMMYVTVTPEHSTTLEQFKTTVEKWRSNRYIESVTYAYEQSGNDESTMGNHKHIHAIVKTNETPAKFEKNIRSNFKEICKNKNSIDVKKLLYQQFVNDKLEYIKGNKTGEGKDEKCEMDKPWRQQNNLQDLYEYENENLL